MLLNIEKHRVELGMFVEAVACPVHEFPKRRFILENPADLEAILSSSATHVQINTALGNPDGPAVTAGAARLAKKKEAYVSKAVEPAVQQLGSTLRDIAYSHHVDTAALASMSSALGKAVDVAPDVFVKVTRLKTKDTVTYLHSVAVSALMMRIGQVMELPEETVSELGIAGLVHDVGKLLIADEILKKPGVLKTEERALMREHPQIGFELLKSSPKMSPLMLDVCLSHHELLDGSGYPAGLKAGDLPLHCRIAAVCDVFEALTSVRPYKAAWPIGKALKWLYDQPDLYDYRIVGRLHEGLMPRQKFAI